MTVQQDRVAKGLCPQCGKEAAPYRLCPDHRMIGMIARRLNRVHKIGGVSKEMRGGKAYYTMKDRAAWDKLDWRDPQPGDRRLRPRLRGIPVDVERTLIEIISKSDSGMTMDQIIQAWGKLRATRAGTIVGDVLRIAGADQKRARKAAKLAALAASGAIATGGASS